jgi:hypothetical protein
MGKKPKLEAFNEKNATSWRLNWAEIEGKRACNLMIYLQLAPNEMKSNSAILFSASLRTLNLTHKKA